MTQARSRKPMVNEYPDFEEDEDHSYQPPSSLSVNNSFTHQSTMGSWGFGVNRSTNGQTLSHTNNNNDQQTIHRTTKGYNEQFVDRASSPQVFKLRTPTLTRQRNGSEFSAVDRLVHGSSRSRQTDDQRSDELFQPPMSPNNQHTTQTAQELLAWQHRMLEREQRFDHPSPKLTHQGKENNSSRSSIRQIPTSMRPISAVSIVSGNQLDHDESTIKSARVIKRYIELLYHLQSFYERITDQLFNGNHVLMTNHTIFTNHCDKIAQQLQKSKPRWEEKLSELQKLLKDIASSQFSIIETETTFFQRRSTLNNLFQTLSTRKDLDRTSLSIRSDIDRVLHDDKLAVQLQDELSTLLQHQSLLNDFTSLLQWNRLIYSSNEQNRVENVLPLLREQMITTDSYISHVSQQLSELVIELRSMEKYILSYTNAGPSMDEVVVSAQRSSSNRGRWRPYDETDIHTMQTRESRQTTENISKLRSISMPRFEDLDHPFNRDDSRHSSRKNIDISNSNNNLTSTRLATIKSAKRDPKPPLNSILKVSSNRRKTDYDIDMETFKPDQVDIPDRLTDDDDSDDEQMLTMKERLTRMKKKEDVRKMISKQSGDQDFNDSDNRRRCHLQSILAEEAKEKSRQVAAKHYLNKSYQRRSAYPND